jgi:hypothetical protein
VMPPRSARARHRRWARRRQPARPRPSSVRPRLELPLTEPPHFAPLLAKPLRQTRQHHHQPPRRQELFVLCPTRISEAQEGRLGLARVVGVLAQRAMIAPVVMRLYVGLAPVVQRSDQRLRTTRQGRCGCRGARRRSRPAPAPGRPSCPARERQVVGDPLLYLLDDLRALFVNDWARGARGAWRRSPALTGMVGSIDGCFRRRTSS